MLATHLGFAEKPFQVNRPLPQGGGRFPSSEIFTLYFLCERDLTGRESRMRVGPFPVSARLSYEGKGVRPAQQLNEP